MVVEWKESRTKRQESRHKKLGVQIVFVILSASDELFLEQCEKSLPTDREAIECSLAYLSDANVAQKEKGAIMSILNHLDLHRP